MLKKQHMLITAAMILILNVFGCSDKSKDDDPDPAAPAITSSAGIDATVGVLYSYTITASGYPKPAIEVAGLPSWLAFNDVDTISGTPGGGDVGTTGNITVTAANGIDPDNEELFAITVVPAPEAPAINSTAITTGTVGVYYEYEIQASGYPAPAISVSGLPDWLEFNGTDIISGTPEPGDDGITGSITVTAANGVSPDAQQVFSITIDPAPQAPAIDSTAITTGTVGVYYEYEIQASGYPAPAISVSGLPAWLSFNGTDLISGTPANGDDGTTGSITVTAANGVSPAAVQEYTIDVEKGAPTIDGVEIFPLDNEWNQDISDFPVHPNSDDFLAVMGTSYIHFDMSIPFVTVDSSQANATVTITNYWDESDQPPLTWPTWPGRICQMPIPDGAPIEGDGAGDAHVLVLDTSTSYLYELYHAAQTSLTTWDCYGAAVWDLTQNDTRYSGQVWTAPDVPGPLINWTSADAAGLPILPGLIRYDEVMAGEIRHALRCTFSPTQSAYVYPASHEASSLTYAYYPPMGLRIRLKADVDISGHTPEVQVILTALKKYGMIVADNGSDWFISGEGGRPWNFFNLNEVHSGATRIDGSDFEIVYTYPVRPH